MNNTQETAHSPFAEQPHSSATAFAANLLSGFKDGTRLYRLEVSACAGEGQGQGDTQAQAKHKGMQWGELLLHSWGMREGLGETGEIQLQALTRQAQLDLQELLGQRIIIWTRLANGQEHPRSGIVTAARCLGSDGGFTRWHITLQPWLGLLALQRRSQVWQEQSVQTIIDSILNHYSAIATPAGNTDSNSALFNPKTKADNGQATANAISAPAGWSWSACAVERLQQSHQQGIRSYVIQYRETDLEFVERLLAEEHLTWRLQAHPQDPASQHLTILAETNNTQSCPPDATSQRHNGIRFHGEGSQQEEDAVHLLHAARSLHTADLRTSSWDYRSKHTQRHDSQSAAALGSANAPRWMQDIHLTDWRHSGQADGQHHLRHIQTALDASRKCYLAESSVRTLQSGSRLNLRASTLHNWAEAAALRAENPDNSEAELLTTHVIHAGLNNLPDGLVGSSPEQRQQALAWLPAWISAATRKRAAQLGYANQFESLPAATSWLPLYCKADGQLLPGNAPQRPCPGLLRATVTDGKGAGEPGELHLDALGRIRIRFDFQQTAQDTQSAAEHTSTSSCWVRVLQRMAGPGWGSQYIPRIGQEVLVDFIGGDIHRPLVIGSLYNGQGEGSTAPTPGGQQAQNQQQDTQQEQPFTASHDHRSSDQGNLIANGHSPAWHAAAAQAATAGASGHGNADALSGHKTAQYPQPHAAGADHNQIVFDDSNRQLRMQLSSSQAATQLNLGHLIHQADNHRGSFRGQGFELRTDAWGAIRGGQGVLISSYSSQHKEPAADNIGGIALARQLHTLAQTGHEMLQKHQNPTLAAQAGSTTANSSLHRDSQAAIAAHLTSIKGMVSSASLQAAQTDAHNYNTHTGQAATAEMQPQNLPSSASALVQIASADGLIATAARSQHMVAGEHIVHGSAEHLQIASGGFTRIHAGQAIGFLAGMLQQPTQGQGSPHPAAAKQNTANSPANNRHAAQPGPLAAQQAAGTGLNVIAAQGQIVLQAQNGPMQVAARSDVDIQSAQNINWSAAKHIKLKTTAGACITIRNGQIEVKCPGTITIHSSQKQFMGPATVSQQMNSWPKTRFDKNVEIFLHTGEPAINRKFEILREDGTILRGTTDAQGKTGIQKSELLGDYTVTILE